MYERIASESKFSIHRLRITLPTGTSIPNDKSVTVASTELQDGDTIQVKDLGPQIAWRTVFIIEYLGPLLIHPLIYYLRPYIYTLPALDAGPSTLQTLSLAMIVLHFLKRELETLFVHRFSLATMPFLNVFKNSAHYWLFSGVLIAYFTYSPTSPTANPNPNPLLTYSAVALYVFGELANLSTHLSLRSLRRPGSTERGVPRGLGFGTVTCPNYTFESIAWIAILMVNRHWSTALFIAIAVGQMAVWAKKKERRYRKELGGKYKAKKFAMVPGIW